MARLSLSFLGPFQVALDGQAVAGFESNKARALLAYLAVESHRPHARESLAGLLWPDFHNHSAINNLRSALASLRGTIADRAADPPYLLITRATIQFNRASDYELDVESFAAAAPRTIEEMEAVVAMYRGDFLEGFSLPDSTPWEGWLRVRREEFRHRALDALIHPGQQYQNDGQIDQAIHCARRQLELEPWDELAHRRLMRLLVRHGRRDLALGQFELCRRVLERELGIGPDEETVALYEAIRAEMPVPAAPEPPFPGETPFKGLSYFDEADAVLFFGREALTGELVASVRDCLAPENGQARVISIIGASGSGKSSIVRAGLVPAARGLSVATGDALAQPFRDTVHVLTPTAAPLESLAGGLRQAAGSILSPAALVNDLAADSQTLHLAAARLTRWDETGQRLLLVVDQFEEIFSLCRDEAARRAFIDNLIAAATTPGPVVVVLALRADFYEQCAPFAGLRRALAENQFYIGAMSHDELRRAIEEPARRGGWSIEPGLVDLLLSEVGQQPGALPLLSHALLETWRRREGHTLTLAGYEATGGVAGALAQSAETIFDHFSPPEQEAVRHIFLRLIEPGDPTDDNLPEIYTRRRAALGELTSRQEEADLVQSVLNRLSDARLITIGHDTVEVAHEALIREWPRLRDWLRENRDGLRLHHRLAEAAREWERSGGDEGLLYRRARLAQASEWARAHEDDLNDLERRFLAAGAAGESMRQQREIAAARQLADTEQRRAAEQTAAAVRFRRLAAVLAGALVVAAILLGVAALLAREAERSAAQAAGSESAALASAELAQTREAEAIGNANLAVSRELSLAATNALETDPELSLLLALQALETSETQEAEEALHRAVQANRTLLAFETGGTGYYGTLLAAAPDGTQLATAGESAAVIWDSRTGEMVEELPLAATGSAHHVLAFDGRGENLALVTAGPDRASVTLYRWSLADERNRTVTKLPAAHDESSDIALSPDWGLLAIGRQDGTVDLWDVAAGSRVATLRGHESVVADVAFNPAGNRLATGGTDRRILLWDVVDLLASESPRPLVDWQTTRPDIETGDLGNVHFIADDLLALAYLGVVEVWDVAGGEQPLSIFRVSSSLSRGYDADSSLTRLAIAGQDGTGRIWDLETGAQTLVLARHPLPVDGIAFSPHDRRVFTIDRDGQVRVWDARPQPLGERASISVDTGAFDIELSPDERQMALGNAGGPASLWDAATFERLYSLPGDDGGVYRVSYSPDGRRVAAAGKDGTVRVWDAATGDLLLAFPAHGGGVTGNLFQGVMDVTYSPDGARLATAGADGLARVWDAATGRELITLSGHTDSLYSLAYSPDGRYLATSSDVEDTTVKVWDAQTGDEIYTLAGHEARVWGMAFSPDGRTLVTGGARGIIKAWDMATGRELYTVVDNSDHIGSVAFTPDGQYFITTGEVPLRVRQIADGEEVLTLADPILWSAKVSRDGRWIYAAGVDGMVRVFALRLDDTLDLAYERLTRWWRPDECRHYLHSEQCPAVPTEFGP